MKDVKIITLTNDGYIPYTQNCLKSLEKLGFKDEVEVFAIGHTSQKLFEKLGYTCFLIDQGVISEFQSFRKGNWAEVTFKKFEIIYQALQKYEYVCFTDGDIVFKDARFMEFCLKHIQSNDLLIQNDTMYDHTHENLCSGFMFIRSNERTMHFFDPEVVKEKVQLEEGWGDQLYLNANKESLKYALLPLELFPNGNYFYTNLERLNPYMIHFNWVIGDRKAKNMLKYGEIYLLEVWVKLAFRYLKYLFKKLL